MVTMLLEEILKTSKYNLEASIVVKRALEQSQAASLRHDSSIIFNIVPVSLLMLDPEGLTSEMSKVVDAFAEETNAQKLEAA